MFVNTKRDADDLVAELGMILKGTEALHGDIPQVACPYESNSRHSGMLPRE